MRLKKDRPGSAQPPPKNSPNPNLMSPVGGGGAPARAMSYSGKRPAAAQVAHDQSKDYSSLSQSYMSGGKQRPPINKDLLKLQQPDWADSCKRRQCVFPSI